MAKKIDYTKEQINWLKYNFNKFNTTKELVDEFNIIFNTNYKYDTIKRLCHRLNLFRENTKRNYYTDEEMQWIKDNYKKYYDDGFYEHDKFILDFNIKFNKKIERRFLANILNGKLGLKLGFNNKRKQPNFQLPIGTERKRDNNWYIKIKNNTHLYKSHLITKENWQLKSRYMYEKYNNCKLNGDDFIIFLDGNEDNFEKENLIKLNKIECSHFVGNKFSKLEDINLRKCAVLYSQIQAKLKVSD